MFQMCADGVGLKRIAATLNAEGARSRVQQGRPGGCDVDAEVLYRECPGACCVEPHAQARSVGQEAQQGPARGRVAALPVPSLRIVSEEEWDRARRLAAVRLRYAPSERTARAGRPPAIGIVKHLFSGLLTCAQCEGATLEPHDAAVDQKNKAAGALLGCSALPAGRRGL